MLGHSRCAQTQHEMRITRCRGVVLGNEVETGRKQVTEIICRPGDEIRNLSDYFTSPEYNCRRFS